MAVKTVTRRSQILDIIKQAGEVRVPESGDKFGVSQVTIRNDLAHLEQKNLLSRTHGGAIDAMLVAYDLSLVEKGRKHMAEKQRIGRTAADMIQNGDTILLDSGTTTLEIARRIKNKSGIAVITNALNIATELAGTAGLQVILTGGILQEKSFSLVGTHAEATLKEYFCNKCFLGVDGFHTQYGLTTPDPMEAQLNRLMIEVADQVIVVTDSSKFGKKGLSFIAGLERIHQVITDTGISEQDLTTLKQLGIKVTLV